jgi:acyl carrier protein
VIKGIEVTVMRQIDINEVIDVIAHVLNIERNGLHEDSSSEEIEGWDSLRQLQICMALDERFGVEIGLENIPRLDTVRKFYNYLSSHSC